MNAYFWSCYEIEKHIDVIPDPRLWLIPLVFLTLGILLAYVSTRAEEFRREKTAEELAGNIAARR